MKVYAISFIILIQLNLSAQTFTSSQLPIVVITTNGGTIVDDPKIMVDMGIVNNGPGATNNLTDAFTDYNGKCGIEQRGNSSQDFEKTSYSIELWDDLGQDTAVSLCGMPKEEDWILHGNPIDKSMIRNPLSYQLWRDMGHWTVHTQYVELVIDGEYRGVYILMEKMKRDKNRLDIAKLKTTDISGDQLTGGYIVRIDWEPEEQGDFGFVSNYPNIEGEDMLFQYYYPKAANITTEQKTYLAGYVDQIEEGLFASDFTNSQGVRYNDLLDVISFCDMLIINEISRSVDAYKLSSYMHKDRASSGGKWKAGPAWDFDIGWGNAIYCGGATANGWHYLQNVATCEDFASMSQWWNKLMTDDVFTNQLKCRWEILRNNVLSISSINGYIDLRVTELGPAIDRNWQKWSDAIGQNIWDEPEPVQTSYAGEVQLLKNWITDRIAWLDANMPGDCTQDIISNSIREQGEKGNYDIYPNPTTGVLNILLPPEEMAVYQIMDNMGRTVLAGNHIGHAALTEDVSNLRNGIYIVKFISHQGTSHSRFIKH